MDDTVDDTTLPAPGPTGATAPVRARFVVAFALAYFGYWIAYLTPPVVAMSVYLSIVLPPEQRTTALAVVLGIGGVVGVIAIPLFGRFSDRTTLRAGMRKPWMIVGAVLTVVGLLVTGTATALGTILLGWCVATVGLSATLAALIALLPDHVPHQQRGRVAGVLGLGPPVGAVGGAVLAQALASRPLLMFLVPAGLMVLGVALLLASYRDRRLSRQEAQRLPRLGPRELLGSYWVSPRRHPDFGWTWLSRFLIFMGVATLVTFQAFYLVNQLHVPIEQVPAMVAVATSVHYALAFLVSPVAGWLSDRLERRKVFITTTALLYAVGLGLIAFADSYALFLVGMAVTGIGEGAYTAVDLALVTDVLPNPDQTAKEMGVFNVASTLPPALAPAVAPAFLAIPFLARGEGDNYVALFTASAVFAVLGALAIRPVRAAR